MNNNLNLKSKHGTIKYRLGRLGKLLIFAYHRIVSLKCSF